MKQVCREICENVTCTEMKTVRKTVCVPETTYKCVTRKVPVTTCETCAPAAPACPPAPCANPCPAPCGNPCADACANPCESSCGPRHRLLDCLHGGGGLLSRLCNRGGNECGNACPS